MAAFGWLGTVLMVRHLTDSQWGELSFVLSLLSIVGFISDLKLSRIVLAEVLASEQGAGDVVGSYVGLRSAIGLVSYAVALVWVIVGDYSTHVVLITAIAIILRRDPDQVLQDLYGLIFQGIVHVPIMAHRDLVVMTGGPVADEKPGELGSRLRTWYSRCSHLVRVAE